MAKKPFQAESKKLMELMIHSIYTNKEIFLRELISNASDALDKRRYLSLTDEAAAPADEYAITIVPDKEQRTLTISDNGIGMTREDLEENLGVIAHSGTGLFKENLKAEETSSIIGRFGVGFYSSFMVSETVEVISRAFGAKSAFRWTSSGADGYAIENADKDEVGTEIRLFLKADEDEGERTSDYLEEHRLEALIQKHSNYIRYPVRLGDKTVNSMVPIWQRPKGEVSDEDESQFYQQEFYDPHPPVRTIRVNAEGLTSYRALLFLPSKAPFGYYSKDFEKGLKLYSSGVLIMERCEALLPDHFRFVKGIVESPDLSLNISREMLQQGRELRTIAVNLEKKIKNELKKLLDTDRPAYEDFYREFGLQLKFGVVNDFGQHREMLQDLILFHSSTKQGLVTLKEAVAAMKEDQPYLYYASGASPDRIEALPQVEPLMKKGYEVLYLTDEVDDFVIQAFGEIEGKTLKSASDEDLGLEDEEEKKKTDALEEQSRDLLAFVKESLGGRVKDVRLSRKLDSHAVCLTNEGAITLEMEKYFALIPGSEKPKAEQVLELNGSHPAFRALRQAFVEDRDKAGCYAHLLYQQALLIAGLPVDDPAKFSDEICRLMV